MMSFRRQVFQECRFDDRFSTYDGEDVDFSHRVAQKHDLYCLPVARLEHRQSSEHRGWYRTQDYWQTSIRAQGYLFDKYLTAQPLNYLAMLWSWVGLLLLHGLVYRNRMAWKGIWQGIGEFLRGDSQGGGILDVG
jgi:GT2 family glycosyltransferase